MRQTRLLRTPEELRAWRRAVVGEVGFVPTMGALHQGHATLLRSIRPRCESSVLSIFVNPTQFGPTEDLSSYPRTLERDLEIAGKEGVDVVFAPTAAAMYPEGFSTFVEENACARPLCGESRPGHFRGVTTVVLKLFNLIRPSVALFGLKDAQQYFVLHKMARDLDLDIRVEAMATVREPDGLALSSRNAYLSDEQRAVAPELYRVLKEIRSSQAMTWAKDTLENRGFRVQYLQCLKLPTLDAPAAFESDQPALLAVAAYLGNTRLIDNVILNPEKLSGYRLL